MNINITLTLDTATFRFFSDQLRIIGQKLDEIITKENKIMSQFDDLVQAVADEDVQIQAISASVAKINADVEALLAKTNLPPDISASLTQIKAHTAALVQANALLAAEDAKANSTAPVITSPLTADGTNGQPFSYQIAASQNPTSFGASNLPAGLSVDATTGLISGTPTAAGTSVVGISATNAIGAGTANLTITVS